MSLDLQECRRLVAAGEYREFGLLITKLVERITELEAENREVENSLVKERDDDGEIIKHQRERITELAAGVERLRAGIRQHVPAWEKDRERIAQLETALRKIDEELDAWGDERLRAKKEAVRKIACTALAKEPQ